MLAVKNPIQLHNGKCFTYVTKTHANLTTCSRKPENYNGAIIFEIDIIKKSSPINGVLESGFLLYADKFARVLVTYVKKLHWCNKLVDFYWNAARLKAWPFY